MNNLLLLWCPIDAVGSLFFLIRKKIDHVCLVRFLQFVDHSGGSIEIVGGYGSVLPIEIVSW